MDEKNYVVLENIRDTRLLIFADWPQTYFLRPIRSGQFKRFWNWFSKSKCPGARLDLTVNFLNGHFIDPSNCPWVSEDAVSANLFTLRV